MRRRLFTIASALSLLFCAATVVLWVRSYWMEDILEWSRITLKDDPASDFVPMDRYYSIKLTDGTGCFMVEYGNSWEQRAVPIPTWRYNRSETPFDFHDIHGSLWARLGFSWETGGDGVTDISTPLWLLLGFFGVPPVSWSIWFFMTRHRRETNLCPDCSYNLAGNTSGVCPECGTAIGSKDVPIKIA